MELIYDLWKDSAGIGSLREILMVGDTFEENGKTWVILEVDRFNGCLIIEENINES